MGEVPHTNSKCEAGHHSFGRLIDLARAGPVAVAKHGRPAAVVMGIEEYDRLLGIEVGQQYSPNKTDGADECLNEILARRLLRGRAAHGICLIKVWILAQTP